MFGHHSVQGRGQGDQGPREVQVTPEQVKGRLPETPDKIPLWGAAFSHYEKP